MDHDFEAILEQLVVLAKETGNLLLDFFNAPLVEDTKSSGCDMVSEADKKANTKIMEGLKKIAPEFGQITEEELPVGIESCEYVWIVDPLDATTNFLSKLPQFCVSIGLSRPKDHKPILGVIYDPTRKEMFTAIRGKGAYLNGKTKLSVSQTKLVKDSVVVSGFPYWKWTSDDDNTAEFCAFVKRARGIRRLGSASLDMAWVAAGRLAGYWEQGPKSWDVNAGLLFVEEAGGKVTDYAGRSDYKYFTAITDGMRICATNGLVHEEMLSIVQDARKRKGFSIELEEK